MMDDDDDDKLT